MPSSTPETSPTGDPYRPEPAAPPPSPPQSATHFGLCLVTLAVAIGTGVWLKLHPIDHDDAVLVLCASVAVPMILMDLVFLKVHRRESTGLAWDRPFNPDVGRTIIKLLGLCVTLAPFAFAYWCFNYYRDGLFDPAYNLLKRSALFLPILVPVYFFLVDGKLRQPRDTYWQLGRLAMGRTADLVPKEIANHYRGWLVKAFFFPFMFAWLGNSTRTLMSANLGVIHWGNMPFDLGRDFLYFIDLLFCTVGYALSLRPLDTHIRTAEPTMLGWGVALFCYPPFFDKLFDHQYVPYEATHFGKLLVGHPQLMGLCATGILTLVTIYSLATVAFGLRFSNLTHRGILTNGPYRWTKHPAYVTKNLSWWLTALPFVAFDGNVPNAIKRCLMLLVINFMYFMRAKTEERHLSRDPKYVEYALWMNDNGWLKFLNRIPIFRYVPPKEALATVNAPAAGAQAEVAAHAE